VAGLGCTVGRVALLLVPFFLLRRLYRSIGAARDQQRGVLRQGILVGPEGLLVRIEPNQCYPIAGNRFIESKIRVSGGGAAETEEKHLFRIETLDGSIEFFSERLADSPGKLNNMIRELKQQPDRTKSNPRGGRQIH
jgi:hypothetical protein